MTTDAARDKHFRPPIGDLPAGPAAWIAVREVMNRPAASVPADAPLGVAVSELLRTRTDRVWVTAPGGALAGVLTDAALLRLEARGADAAAACGPLAAPATPLHASADAAAAVARFGPAGDARVPVVDRGKLAGELTRADVLELVHAVRRVASVAPAGVAGDPVQIGPARSGPNAPRFLSRARRRAAGARRAAAASEDRHDMN